jgi:ubiquinone/menaquinone biosynthesis C-methylase UbiE
MASFDPQAVRAFEHAGWQRAAADYRATFARATTPFVERLLEAAGVARGMQVLDLCCGPGVVAAAVAARGAVPVGLDFSAAMLARARALHPAMRFDEADAEAMPYPDASFDAVVSNFGIHHAPEPARALAEARRVLRPGGRIACTSWAAPEENIAWKLLFDVVAAHGAPDAVKTPPPGGSIRRPEDARQLLRQAGFAAVEAQLVRQEWQLAEAGELIDGFRRGTARTAALIEAQPSSAIAAIAASLAAAVEQYRAADGYAVPIVAILAGGRA